MFRAANAINWSYLNVQSVTCAVGADNEAHTRTSTQAAQEWHRTLSSLAMAEERAPWFTPEEYAKYSVEDRLSSVPARIRPVAHATPAGAEAQLPLASPPPHVPPGLLQSPMPTMDPAAVLAAAVAPYIAAQFGQQLPPARREQQ